MRDIRVTLLPDPSAPPMEGRESSAHEHAFSRLANFQRKCQPSAYCGRLQVIPQVLSMQDRSIGGRCFLDEEKPLHCCQVRGKRYLLTRRNVLLCRNRMSGFKILKWIDPDVPMLRMWYDLGWGLQLREIPRVLAAISWHWRARLPPGEISSSVLKWGRGVGSSRAFITYAFLSNSPGVSDAH